MCRVNANVSQLEHLEPLTQMPFNLSFLLSHEWRFSNSPSFLAALVLLSVNQSLIIFYIESAHYNWSTIITSPVDIQTLIVWRHLKQVTVRPHYFWSRITQCGRGLTFLASMMSFLHQIKLFTGGRNFLSSVSFVNIDTQVSTDFPTCQLLKPVHVMMGR